MQARRGEEHMLTRRRQKLAAIHIAKKELGIADADYRALLLKSAGVRSAADLKNDTQYFALMRAFRAAGYKPGYRVRKKRQVKEQNYHCSEAQRRYIKGLWSLASRSKTERSRRAMIRRICGVDDLRFLTKAKATAVILALRDMAEKAGFNPDRKTEETHGRL